MQTEKRCSVIGVDALARGFILGEKVRVTPPTSSTGIVTGTAPDVDVFRVLQHRPHECKEGEIPQGWDTDLTGSFVYVSYKLETFRMGDKTCAVFPDGQAIACLHLQIDGD